MFLCPDPAVSTGDTTVHLLFDDSIEPCKDKKSTAFHMSLNNYREES